MKYLPLFLLLTFSAFGQTEANENTRPTPSNFEKFMEAENPSEEDFASYLDLMDNYFQKNLDTCLILSERMIDLTKSNKNLLSMHGRTLRSKANVLANMGRDSVEYFGLKAKNVFEQLGDSLGVAQSYRNLGVAFRGKGELEKSLDFFLKAIVIYKQKRDTLSIISSLEGIAGVYFYMGNTKKTAEYMEEAIAFADRPDALGQRQLLLCNQAMLYSEIARQIKADTFNGKVPNQELVESYYKKGLKSAEEAVLIAEDMPGFFPKIRARDAVAVMRFELKDYDGSAKSSEEALAIAKKTNNPEQIIHCIQTLIRPLEKTGEVEKAIEYAESGFEMASERGFERISLSLAHFLFKTHKKHNRTKASLTWLEKVFDLEKKGNKEKTQKAIAEAETKYQTAEKEREILLQKNDILELKTQNAEIQKQRNYLMTGGILFSLLGFFGYQLNKLQKDRNDKKAFAEALIFAQEEERKRIARDLHDGIGQSLLLIKKQLATTTEVTMENQKMISQTLEEVRSISRDLHPFQLEKAGLTATIEDTILKIEDSTELFISKEIENIDGLLPSKSEIHLFRTVQEALSNIVKHSEATAAKVSINNQADKINVTIQDNGEGFDLELQVETSKSLGLKTMYERIASIGGELKIEKGEKNGTVVTIAIPIK